MGSFYGSVQVRGDGREPVLQAAEQVARDRKLRCLVGPVIDGWIGIYPENNGQDESFGQAIAALVGGDVLHFMVHDDDITAYRWWREGKLLDSFWSTPGYFGEEDRASQEAQTGQPELLAELAPGKAAELRRILARDERQVIEGVRLQRLAGALGICNTLTAYEYLKAGERRGVRGWRQFTEVPRDVLAREKQAGRVKRQQLNANIKRMKASGLLLLREVREHASSRVVRAGEGFLLGCHGLTGIPPELWFYTPPWQTGLALSVATGPHFVRAAADASGSRVAMALGRRFAVWNAESWQTIVELPEEDWGHGVALSADGMLAAFGARKRTRVVEVDSGRVIATLPGYSGSLAIHPSKQWLVATDAIGLLVATLVDGEPSWRRMTIRNQGPSLESFKEAQIQATIQAAMEQAVAKAKAEHKVIDEAKLAQARVMVEQQVREAMTAFLDLANAETSRRGEGPMMIGFSSDSRRFWCGTEHGLRVYAWDQVVAAEGDEMPPPVHRHDTAVATPAWHQANGHVYTAVEEPGGDGLLFGGINGRFWRMDLGSGQVCELLAMPEEEPIVDAVLSRDHRALGIVSTLRLQFGGVKRDEREFWSVWSYERLRERGG